MYEIEMKMLSFTKTPGYSDDVFYEAYYYWETFRKTYRGRRYSGEGFIALRARVNRYGLQYLKKYCTCPNYHFHGECSHLPVAVRMFEEEIKSDRGN